MLLQVYYTQCQMFQSAECCFPKLLVLPEMNLLPAVCAVFLGTLELENCKVCAVSVLIFVIPTSSKIVIPFFCELNSALHESKARGTAQQSVTSSSSIYLDQTSLNYKQDWVLVQQAIVCHFFLGVCVQYRVFCSLNT